MSDGVYRVGLTPPPTCAYCGKEWKDGGRYHHTDCLEAHAQDAILRYEAKRKRPWLTGDNIAWSSIILSALTIAIIGVYCFINMLLATNRAEFCYTEPDSRGTQTYLKASIAWENDRIIGTFPSIYEAKKAADAIGCPLK